MPAKVNTQKSEKAKASPAKTAAKPAKGKAKAPAKVARTTPTITSTARVRQHINYHGVNREIHAKLEEFNKANEKITTNKDVVAIQKDEELLKKYLAILRFNPGNAPEKMDSKEKRDKWRASQLEAHNKTVAAAIKKDAKLAIFAKNFKVHELRRVISNDMKRFSKGSYIAIAAVMDEVILSILRTAMSVVLSHNKRMLTPAYCVTNEMESNPYFCLFSNIKPFVDARNRLRELTEQQNEEESETQTKGKKGKKPAKKEEAEEEEESEDNEDAPVTRAFQHYVGNIAKTLTNDTNKKNQFQNIRISNDVRVYCSDIIVSILNNLGVALGHLLRNAKTINESLIRDAFATIMTYNGADPAPLLASIDRALTSATKAKPKTAAKPAKGKPAKGAKQEETEEDEADEESSASESE